MPSSSLEVLFYSNPQPMWVYDLNSLRFLEVNDAALSHYGYTREEFLRLTIIDLRPPEDVPRLMETLKSCSGDSASCGQWRHLLKNGRVIDVEVNVQAIDFKGRKAQLAVIRDITSALQTERLQAALYRIATEAHSAEDLTSLYRSIHIIISELMFAKNFYIAIVNQAGLLSFPYWIDEHDPAPKPRPLRKGITEYVLRRSEPLLATQENFPGLVAAGEIESIGSDSVDWLGVPLTQGNKAFGVLAVQSYDPSVRYTGQDKEILSFVSQQVANTIERKHAEAALRESEIKFRTLAETAPSAIYIFDVLKQQRFTYVNPATERLTGFSAAELLEMTVLDIVHPEDHAIVAGLVRQRHAGQTAAFHYEARVRTKTGEIRWGDITGSMIQFQGAPQVLGIANDITERKRAEEEIHRAETRYRALVEQLEAITYIAHLGFDGAWVYASPQIERILGYSPEEFMADRDLYAQRVHPDDRALVEAAEQGTLRGLPFQADYRMIRRDGHVVWVSDSGVLVKTRDDEAPLLHGVMLDITGRKQLESQLQQAQKMEAVGTLAGGVAHDFNNLLTVIKGYSRLVMEQAAGDEQLVRQLGEIEKSADRAAALTSQLLAFSRRQMIQPKVLSLNSVVSHMEKMLRRVIGEDVQLITQLDPKLATIKADPGQLEQVLLNLAINARDAMSGGGKLCFETSNVHLAPGHTFADLDAPAGDYAVVTVSDTGTGMDEKTRARVFEPFFTTKEVGKGTGLGLAMVYGIVKQSGGYIIVESKLGAGTTFRIYFPQIAAAESAEPPPPSRERFQGSETILLVEDDDSLRELTRRILARLGYTVLLSSHPAEAESVCRTFDGNIHAMLTDVIMPGGSGCDLAVRLASLRPEMKVVLMSGYADRGMEHHESLDGNVNFLPKPFSPHALAAKLREILDAAAAAPG